MAELILFEQPAPLFISGKYWGMGVRKSYFAGAGWFTVEDISKRKQEVHKLLIQTP
jgi:hypothetical protein